MLNEVSIMGRMTKDPELRYTASNIPVCYFTLACDRDIKNKDGERQTDFINCVAWRQTGEFVSKYFHKGSMAIATGRLEVSSYKKDGENRTSVNVNAERVYFGEKKTTSDKLDELKRKFENVTEADGDLPF